MWIHGEGESSKSGGLLLRTRGMRHEENADLNASRVIRKRGVKMILEGLVKKKESKKLLRVPRAKKRNIGVDRPESMPAEPSVCSCVLHGVVESWRL